MCMSARSRSLEERIAEEIRRNGPILFSRFMELALYDPDGGYYAAGRARIGRSGDFFTNVSVGPLFGALLARQVLELRGMLGNPDRFLVVEQGANDGQLAKDVLDGLRAAGCGDIPYWIVEPFKNRRTEQSLTLQGENVRWVASPDELPQGSGVHLSNELFDALPFDIAESNGFRWHLMAVEERGDGFGFVDGPPVDHLPGRPAGFRFEVRRDQKGLLRSLANRLTRGFLLIIDYGFERDELLAPHRSGGTLACYKAHRRDDAPLENPGRKDITAHVDFTTLREEAVSVGWRAEAMLDQHRFMVGAAESLLKSLDGRLPDAASAKILQQWRTLMHPSTMGTQFRAALFSNGVDCPAGRPSGFRYARKSDRED